MKIVGLIVPSLGVGYLLDGEMELPEFRSVDTVVALSISNLTLEYEDHVDHEFQVQGTSCTRNIQGVGTIVVTREEER